MPRAEDRPIIVAGSHRSGTSLVRRLLNGHSRIFCPAEIKFHKDLLRQFPADPLRHGRLGSSIAALGLAEDVWLDEFGRALVNCYRLAAARQGKARWADKNPENCLNVGHWDRLLGGEFHFVLVLRNPLDVLASMAETPMPLIIPTTLQGRAEHVMGYVDAGLDECEAHPERSTVLRYEDLVSDPTPTVRGLCDRLGERFEPAMLTGLDAARHGSGLEDPKIARRDRPASDSVGRWRADLSGDDQAFLTGFMGPTLRRAGY